MAGGWTNEFTLKNPYGDGEANNFQLKEPTVGAVNPSTIGDLQTGSGVGSLNLGDWAPAGIGAAGQAVHDIAQVAGQKAVMDRTAASNDLSRAFSEKIAKMQLAANAQQANQQNKLGAYELLLRAYGNQQNNTLAGLSNNRNSAAGISDLLARVMLSHGRAQ